MYNLFSQHAADCRLPELLKTVLLEDFVLLNSPPDRLNTRKSIKCWLFFLSNHFADVAASACRNLHFCNRGRKRRVSHTQPSCHTCRGGYFVSHKFTRKSSFSHIAMITRMTCVTRMFQSRQLWWEEFQRCMEGMKMLIGMNDWRRSDSFYRGRFAVR